MANVVNVRGGVVCVCSVCVDDDFRSRVEIAAVGCAGYSVLPCYRLPCYHHNELLVAVPGMHTGWTGKIENKT
jgi:hypothetical protein